MVYFGFAIADSMFPAQATITKSPLSVEQVQDMVTQGVKPCLNPSHEATVTAMREKFGITIEIPQTPPRVVLDSGDRVIVMGVRGLPRLTDRHHYTETEVAQATFQFSVYEVK